MISHAKLRIPVSKSDHVQGPAAAPVTLLEYGDYECPYCGSAAPIIMRLQQAMGEDLRFVFRNFPLAISHPHAMGAAQAAEAAALQGKFWEMHDLLYGNQGSLDDDSLVKHAASLDLDVGRFILDVASAEVDAKIMDDLYGGARSGVNGTPTLFINGHRYEGDDSYQALLETLVEARDLHRSGKNAKSA